MRSLSAVVVALVLVVGVMILTNVVLVKFVSPAAAAFLEVTLVCAALYHLAGGYLAAVIARDATAAAWGLVLAGTAVMVGSVHQTWSAMPPWYSCAMLVIVPVALWMGANLHRTRRV